MVVRKNLIRLRQQRAAQAFASEEPAAKTAPKSRKSNYKQEEHE